MSPQCPKRNGRVCCPVEKGNQRQCDKGWIAGHSNPATHAQTRPGFWCMFGQLSLLSLLEPLKRVRKRCLDYTDDTEKPSVKKCHLHAARQLVMVHSAKSASGSLKVCSFSCTPCQLHLAHIRSLQGTPVGLSGFVAISLMMSRKLLAYASNW